MISWSDRPDTAPDPARFSTSRTTFVEGVGGGGDVLASCNQQSEIRHVSKADTERLIGAGKFAVVGVFVFWYFSVEKGKNITGRDTILDYRWVLMKNKQ